jgi:oligopeptide transport system substrate-binding protein
VWLLAALVGALLGCGLPEEEYFGRIPEPDSSHLRWCLGDPQSLDPARYELAIEDELFTNLYDVLLRPDARVRPKPALAKSWHVADGHRTFTFRLREDARFSNGRPLTAHDVRFTVMRTLHPLFAATMGYRFFPIRNAEAYNAGRLKVVLRDVAPFRANEVVELLEKDMPDPNLRAARQPLQLHENPDESSDAYASVPRGGEVTLVDLSSDGRWAYVHRAAGEGVFGWVELDRLGQPHGDQVYQVHAREPGEGQLRRGSLRGRDLLALPSILGIHVTDDHTVTFELERPTPFWLLRSMTVYVVAREAVSRWPRSWFRPGRIVTSGPFHLTAWEPRHRLELTRSATFRDRAKVRLERVTIHVADNAAARGNLYYAGECDQASAPPASYDQLLLGRGPGARPRRDVHKNPWGMKTYADLNVRRLDSPHLRRALAHAIDRRELRELLPGGAIPSHQYSLCYPASMLTDAELERCGMTRDTAPEICLLEEGRCYLPPSFPEFDVAAARRELAAARHAMGESFPESLIIRYAVQNGTRRRLAIWLQSTWERHLGLTIEVRGQDLNTLIRDVLEAADHDVVLWGIATFYHPEDWLLPGPQCGNPLNGSHFCDPEYERLLRRAGGEGRIVERIRLLGLAEARLVDQVPLLPLYSTRELWLAKPYVRGQDMMGPLHEVWIDPGWRKRRP